MSFALSLVLIALQQVPAPTIAPSAPGSNAQISRAHIANSTAAKDTDPVTCRDEVPTGSMFSKHTCMKASEWNASSGEGLRSAQQGSRGGDPR